MGLSAAQASRALTLLAGAAITSPAAAALIGQAIASDPAHLAVPALAVAVGTNPSVGDQIASALQAGHWAPDLLEQIAAALPDASVALAVTGALTYQRLAEHPASGERRAVTLVNLSTWLSRLGRREEALAAIEEAVTIRRELARARPDAFGPDLAASLNNQSVLLSDLGRREEALAAIEEAVTAYRRGNGVGVVADGPAGLAGYAEARTGRFPPRRDHRRS